MLIRYSKYVCWIAFVISAISMLVSVLSSNAMAFDLNTIPESLNDAVFDGQNLMMAKYLLATCIMVSVGLAMAVAKFNMIATVIVLLGLIGFLTALGWVDVWLILLAALLIVAISSKNLVAWITGGE